MLKNLVENGARIVRRLFLVSRGCLLGILCLLLAGDPVLAQLPSGDQLQELQQQYKQRQNQNFGQPATSAQDVPQSIVLQPSVPARGLSTSRLEQILSTRAGTKLTQFGYDQLGSGRPVTVPQTGAVQDDYILGPGDEIIVSMRGQENGEFRSTVDRNGRVVLPRLPPLSAMGRELGSFRNDLEAAVHRAYVATEASVSIGRVRQISVMVSGEVNQPGSQLLTGLSSAMDALLIAGGVKKTGSLRNIRIDRGGRKFLLDLYSVLTDRGAGHNIRLMDGDRILVPPLGPVAAVAGMVRRPGIFELDPHSSSISARLLQSLAGGAEVKGRYRLSVLRVDPDGQTNMMAANDGAVVHDSEILFVQLGADQTVNQASFSGGSGLAGVYPLGSGKKLSEWLRAPGALGASPYTLFGLISRRDPRTLLRSLTVFTPLAVLSGQEDVDLRSDDIVRTFSVAESRVLITAVRDFNREQVASEQALRNPVSAQADTVLSTPNQGDSSSALAGQAALSSAKSAQDKAAADENSARVISNRASPEGNLSGSAQADPTRFDNLEQRRSDSPEQKRYDSPEQRRYDSPDQGRYDSSDQGRYGSSDQGRYGSSDQGKSNTLEQKNGGYALDREVTRLRQLAEQLGVDALVLTNVLNDHEVGITGAVRGPGTYIVGAFVKLEDLVAAAGGTSGWSDQSGVELVTTLVDNVNGKSLTQRSNLPLKQGILASYYIRPHDEFRFNQVFTDANVGYVTVQGEVRFAGSYKITRGEKLSDVLARAGGLTNTAYPYGTVFLRRAAAVAEREGYVRAAAEVQNQLVIAMTRIGNDKIDPSTFASMQTFVAELRNQKALGRISVVADPSVLVANRELDALLETGDVIYIPQRPSTVAVLGQVLQPGSFPYRSGETVQDYLERAGGYSSVADGSNTFLILPDGSARRIEKSWLNFDVAKVPPGSTIVVPRDVTPLDLRQTIIDISQIFSQFAIAIASVAVLSKQ